MNFQDALKNLLDGKKVRRKVWGKNVFLFHTTKAKLKWLNDNGDEVTLHSEEKFSIEECLAEDWEIFEQ